MSLSTAWLILQPLSSFGFLHKSKRGLTSWLIGLGLSNHPSSPVKAKVECCKSHGQVSNCTATRIPSSSITGCHPWPTGSLVGGRGVYPSAEVQLAYSTAPADWADFVGIIYTWIRTSASNQNSIWAHCLWSKFHSQGLGSRIKCIAPHPLS